MESEATKYVGSPDESRTKSKSIFGKVKFASLREVFKILKEGKELPEHNYTYRIDASKLSKAISFLKESLCVKPGVVRDVNLAGHAFKNMPAYERGGMSIRSLNESYRNIYDVKECVGVHTFEDIVKLMTKRGESKAGLSTYYIQLRYNGRVFISMLKRVKEFSFANSESKHLVSDEVTQLLEEWDGIQRFVMCEYSNRHLKLKDEDICHCWSHALGEACRHTHKDQSCDKCTRCVTFFEARVQDFLERVQQISFTDEKHADEMESMMKAVHTLSFALNHYMAHRLRASIQFTAIDKIKESLKNDPTSILLVKDHKQKVLQMKYREGQVEYYGKKGMSVLGTMIVRWATKTNDDGTTASGFEYVFIDIIMKGYAGQDNVQVAAAVEEIVNQVHERFSEVKNIVFQSDNASCFASQELIPFTFHLNQHSKTTGFPSISNWIYTEAQTGRGRLDTHFSFVNVILKSFVEDGNDIMLEEHILHALSFLEGIAGTTAVLFDVGKLPQKCIEKKFNSKTIGSRATYEIHWGSFEARIFESSDITAPEHVPRMRLEQFPRMLLNAVVADTFFCKAYVVSR